MRNIRILTSENFFEIFGVQRLMRASILKIQGGVRVGISKFDSLEILPVLSGLFLPTCSITSKFIYHVNTENKHKYSINIYRSSIEIKQAHK